MSEDIKNLDETLEKPSVNELEKDRLSLLKNLVQSEDELRKEEKRQKVFKVIRTIFIYLFLFILAVVMIFPFYWMLISSVKNIDEYYLTVPTFWPQSFQFSNYIDAWNKAAFGRYMINTIIVGVTSTLVSLFITILAAFGGK